MPMNIRIAKIGVDVAVPTLAEATDRVKEQCYNHGWGQYLIDAHSSVKRADFKDEASFKIAVANRVDAARTRVLTGVSDRGTLTPAAVAAKMSSDPAFAAAVRAAVEAAKKSAA